MPVFGVALSARAQQQPTQPPPGVKVMRDLEYGTVGERKLLLDLYVPEKATGPLPVIVGIHGGGWAAGSKEGAAGIRQAGRGYAVACVGYRLSGEAIFPAQIEDCKAAVRWLRANAARYGLDPDRIGATGHSAGGHLSSLLGTTGGIRDFDLGKHLEQSSRVQAVCALSGPTDLLRMDAHAVPGARLKHDAPGSPESRLIGGAIQENKDKAARANPITYVTKDSPPFLLIHGDQDPVVPPHQAQLLFEALKQAGVEARLHLVAGAGHGVGGREVNDLVDAFFDRHLKPAGAAGPIPAPGARAEPPTGLLFFASYPERDNTAAIANPHIIGALHTIYWSNVEPADGQYDWKEIDRRIGRWTAAGKKVALRIMWSSSGNWPEPAAKHPTPGWVLERGAVTVHSDSSRTDIPLVWDPVYRKYASRFLAEVARKFDGNPDILFIDLTPGAETNPYRFRRINVQEPEFKVRFASAAASDGTTYSHELWLDAVKRAVDDAAAAFQKTKLLVTLNTGSLDGPSQMQAIGDYCVGRGCYVGQNGLRGDNYAKDSPRTTPFLAWGKQTRLYFEMLDATSQGTTGSLRSVMEAAQRVGCDYLGAYAADVLRGTRGQPDFDPAYEEALAYGAQALGDSKPPAQPLAGFQRDGERWTYQDGSLSMHGILLEPEGKGPHPGVLISHGLGGSAQSFGLGKARELVRWGFVCIACDYTHSAAPGRRLDPAGPDRQSFGASEENLRRASKCLDILASLPGVDRKRLCAYGHSMGGFVTIGLAAKEPDRLVAAAISGSGVAPRAGFPAPAVEQAGRIKTPFIIFHGEADNTVRPAQSAALKEVLDKNGIASERHTFVGTGHPVDREKASEVYGLMRRWFVKQGVPLAEPAGALAPVGDLRQPPPPPAPPRAPADAPPQWVREKVEARNTRHETFKSATIGQDVSYLIYLPREYTRESSKRYPVLYWLHGIGGAQTGIPRLVERFDGAIEAGKTPPMLVVFVNGVRDSFYCDSVDGKALVESVFIKDLIPHIDAAYRTVVRREGRIIEGFSMGGFGAAHLGFKYPELFGTVSMIDAALVTLDTMRDRHTALFQRIFGGKAENFEAEDPRVLVARNAAAIRGRTRVRLAVGALVAGNRSFRDQLTALEFAHDYDEVDAGHIHGAIYDGLGEKNWEFYRRCLADAWR
jgi:dipeptidyl aminopeptidase/acylaminoacyl peptidase